MFNNEFQLQRTEQFSFIRNINKMNIILFDGICNLCNKVILFIIKRDKKALFRFAAIQSNAGQALIKRYAVQNNQNSTIYYIRDNKCFQRSTAILHILKDLGGIWKCFYLFILIPTCIRDIIYLSISRNRYKLFGKRRECMIYTPDMANRFID